MSDDLFNLFMNLENADKDFHSGQFDRSNIIKAPFNYNGSKREHLQHILPHLPYRKGFVEVFGGSGVVLLNRERSAMEVFNDRLSGIVDFYRCLQDHGKLQELIDKLEYTVHSREWYALCRDWESCQDIVERAALWYYVQRYSFAGQGRFFGRSTAPKGSISGLVQASFPLFRTIHQRLQRVTFENLDWSTMLADFDHPDTVFYLDPPYYKVTQQCYRFEMKPEEHEQMLETVMNMQSFVAVSSYHNPLYDSYDWDEVHEWDMTSRVKPVSQNESHMHHERERHTATECLYIKE